MKRILTALLGLCALLSCRNGGDCLVLKTDSLKVAFDKKTALLDVRDLRNGRSWHQSPADTAFKLRSAELSDGAIRAVLESDPPLSVEIRAEGASIRFRIGGDLKAETGDFSYPAPFHTEGRDWYILETDGEGMLLPVDNGDYNYGDGITYFCGGGLSMAWKGVVDKNFESGYQAVLETPYDACLRTFRQKDGLLSFKPVWLPSMQKISYERVVTYNFFDKGGYVAQCKKYRAFAWERFGVRSLKDKMRDCPALEKMIGAVHIYTWDSGREVSMLKEMKAAGIDKLFVCWDANHTPYPAPGYDNAIRELGYAAGGYELFTDLHPRDSVPYPYDWKGPLRHKHGVFPGQFKKLAARKADGKTYSNQFGTYACPPAMQDNIKWKLDRVVREYPHEGLFLDVYQANGLYECYNPEHPVTREGYANAILENYKLIQQRYGFYLGGEWGAEFALPMSSFNHGMMTLQRPWWGSEIDDKGSIFYYGDWKDHERPSIMLTTCTAGPTYYKYCINEAIRVPLYELVYHDAAVSTWRWEDGNPRYPELWWKKDLFNMLYGTAPLWILDRALWEKSRETYVSSYGQVCSWLGKVALDEMTDHRFLTPNGKVQMSSFSSGRAIVVNFSDSDFVYDGKTVEARGYVEIPAV